MACVIQRSTYIRQHIGVEAAHAYIHTQRLQHKLHTAHLGAMHIVRHQQRRGVPGCGVGFGAAQRYAYVGVMQQQCIQGELSLGEHQSRTHCLQPLYYRIDPYGRYQRIGVERCLLQTQFVHHDRHVQQRIGAARGQQRGTQTQGAGVEQSVFAAMSDKQTVHLYLQRQVGLTFVRTVQTYRRVLQRREVQIAEIDVIIRACIGFRHGTLQHSLTYRVHIQRTSRCCQQDKH